MKYKIINCVKILVYFIILILQCEARETAENPVIKLEYGRNSNDEYYVEKDKSLKIVIKNSQARYVTCYNYYSGTPYIDKEYPNYDQDSVITIASVTPQMSTRWRCQILQKNHGPPVTLYKEENCTVVGFYFHLFVKGA
ncbi:hypothetical protein HF086_011317 [Spodoptera exigua]|uniref:Uncharacterized protein n=1 Tax=Spodoptera exigua TaxID=7107 RepID=A0A922MEQ1_SPOEX|nr:hypothetical protein HF086_011317 [Spodoptera exigua]